MTSQTQRGFGIMVAMFIVVVLGGLAVTLSYLTSRQSIGVALDERGVRAYMAARSGIEWGAYELRITQNLASCFPTAQFSLTSGATSLADFAVKVECTSSSTNSFIVTATACEPSNGGACPNTAPPATYVERQITANIGR